MHASQAGIFITYRREDSAGFVGRLADDLRDLFGPDAVFHDVDALAPGEEFPVALGDAVAQAAAVLVVIGPRWVSSADAEGRPRLNDPGDYVRFEVEHALGQGKPVFPVLVDGSTLPAAEQLPPSLQRLVRFNAIELSNTRWAYDVSRLVDALASVGVTPEPVESFAEQGPAGRAEKRDVWLVPGDLRAVRERVGSFARTRGQGTWAGDVLELRSGSKGRTRLLGGFFVGEKTLPTLARVRLTGRGVKTMVEAMVWESFGVGSFAGMGPRYQATFDHWLADLRTATTQGQR